MRVDTERADLAILPRYCATITTHMPQDNQNTPHLPMPVVIGQMRQLSINSAHLVRYVNTLAFSPDGRTLASGSDVEVIRLWDVATGAELCTLKHADALNALAFSPDGLILAAGEGTGGTIRLWDMTTKTELCTLEGHDWVIESLAFSPDGRTLASGSGDGVNKLWDVATGTELHSMGVSYLGGAMALSPDGLTLVSSDGGPSINVWDVATGTKLPWIFVSTDDDVSSLAFSPDGRILGYGNSRSFFCEGNCDTTIRLWDMATSKELRNFQTHDGAVWSLSFSPDGLTLASGSDGARAARRQGKGGVVHLWDVATGTKLVTLEDHTAEILGLSFSPDGRRLAVGTGRVGLDNTITIYGYEDPELSFNRSEITL